MKKGWVNETKMLWWIENIWTKRRPLSNLRSLLILNSFCAHLVDPVKNRFSEKNTNLAVIPGGLTKKLQPLDVSIIKVSKTRYFLFY